MRRAHKYGARATTVDNVRFASAAEARRYQELKLLEKVGEVSGLELQPRYLLHVVDAAGEKRHVCTYVADFAYWSLPPASKGLEKYPHATRVVEDVKGVRTAMYRLKKKMLLAEYGITVTEV